MSTTNELRDEIAYIRTLAEEGHKPRGSGGPSLVIAGVGYAAASAVQAGVFAGRLPTWLTGWVWLVPMAMYVPALVLLIRSRRTGNGAVSPVEQALNNAWMSVGMAMGSLIAAFIVASIATDSGMVWMMMPSVMIACYGAAWMIYATMSKQAWVTGVAVACFVFAPLVVAFVKDGVQSLLSYSVALLLLVALPGAIMTVQDRRRA